MTTISIVGTGKMGRAIAGVAAKGNNHVQLLGPADIDKPATGDIVILAVHYSTLANVIAARGEQLAGKVVVDISNPVNFETVDSLNVASDSSATAKIAADLPHSSVLKAFNTTFEAALWSGRVGREPTTVLVAGDAADAKMLLTDVITAAGLGVVDVGSLLRARELEAFGFLQISLAAKKKISGFAVVA